MDAVRSRAVAPNGCTVRLACISRAARGSRRNREAPLRNGWSWVISAPSGVRLGDVWIGPDLPDFDAVRRARRNHRKIDPADTAALAALRHAGAQLSAFTADLPAPFAFDAASLVPVTITELRAGYRGGPGIPRFGAGEETS